MVVRALVSGEQILDVRKGGVREDNRHFDLQATRLWLCPTAEHQKPELLKPAYRRWLDDSIAATPSDGSIRVEAWADVVSVATITDSEELGKLASRFIWTTDYAGSRLSWKKRDPLWVLALRAHRLLEPITVPWREEYRGCASWVDLEGLPADPASVPSEPALSDESFAARLQLTQNELPGRFETPGA